MAETPDTCPFRENLAAFLGQPPVELEDLTEVSLTRFISAFTHRSFVRENPSGDEGMEDFEALEFLGDRVLNLIVAEYIFTHTPRTEKEMADRMEFVKNNHLAFLVSSLFPGFSLMIRLGHHQRLTSGIVASAFEAFLGAYFLDKGFDATRSFLLRMFRDELDRFAPVTNYKRELQEHLQKNARQIPVYRMVGKEGPDHTPVFSYSVACEGKILGTGKGRTKAQATQEAARDALRSLGLI